MSLIALVVLATFWVLLNQQITAYRKYATFSAIATVAGLPAAVDTYS